MHTERIPAVDSPGDAGPSIGGPAAGRWRRRLRPLTPALLYAAVSLYLCAGLAWRPLTRVPFFAGDAMLDFWNYWWARHALLDLHASPFATDLLSYPHQVSLVFHAHDFLHGLLSVPIQLAVPGLAGLVLSINVMVFLCYFLSALTAYAAIHLVTGARAAALIAGFGYGFSAFHQAWASMPVIAAMYWVPLFTWLFLRAVRRGGWALLWPGLCVGLSAFQSLYYLLFLGLLCGALAVLTPFTEPGGATVRRRVAAILAAVAVASLPMGVLALRDVLYARPAVTGTADVDAPKDVNDDCRNSIDLAGVVVPGAEQGLWRMVAGPWNDYLERRTCPMYTFGMNGEGGRLVYVGIVPLLLAALAWRAPARRRVLAWTLIALGFTGLALGPYLHVHGTILRAWWLPLPYRALFVGPTSLAKLFHAPAYFWAPALFAIWMLAAFGLGTVFAAPRSRRATLGLRAAVAIWLIVDYAAPPLPTWAIHVSPAYRAIAADPRPGAVLQVPAADFMHLEVYNMLQTVHGKPIARGFLSRVTPAVVRRDQMIAKAYGNPVAFHALLEELGPTYIVVERRFLRTADERRFAAALRQQLADAVVYDDGKVAVYGWRLGAPAPAGTAPGGG